ncbi:Apolipoprotein N-acyltransferase [Methyloligella halotolerans]|uniref:Apolipoprotein N-acyltransferase n=1 Tax=Methyloligella halotolerans TaxID=1177755 RepID=A0A1E2RWD1_9HYPH|nr:apolipoprotein N-acyltransferase [Methyloligella halotolerans]ODA66369.1 Apolipoprotein N-acyltransferase [Methyloligella halotolerans]
MRQIFARLDGLAGWVAALRGWPRAGFGIVAGAVGALAFAPYDLWPFLFLSFGALVWMLDGSYAAYPTVQGRIRSAAAGGFYYGFGFFLANFYWLAEAFLVEPERHGWLIPFILPGFASWMALYFAGATVFAILLWGRGAARVCALAAGFGLFEFIRGHLFTGQPWNLLGYALTPNLPMMQLASLFGIYGLTVLAALLFASPAACFAPAGSHLRGRGSAAALAACLLLLLATGAGWGAWRLQNTPVASTGTKVRIVQASIDQAEKWKPGNADQIFEEYLRLSKTVKDGVGLDQVDLVVWPETAIPVVLENEPQALAIIGDMLPEGGALLAGSIRMVYDDAPNGSSRNVYNGLLAIGHDGRVIDSYDKIHLVPFGEYLPFQSFMESLGIMQMTGIRGGFTAGRGPRRLDLPGLPPLMPLICYEVLFPDEVNAHGRGAAWMLNITNDAWFGRSVGPYQHFHQARVRAVEQGLPLVRAANTGISAVIDPMGRILGELELEKKGVVDATLPGHFPATFFGRYERRIEIVLWLLAVIGCILPRMRQLNNKLE